MSNPTERRSRRAHFVHLGERLEILERIRAGAISRAEAAAHMGVDEWQLLRWMQLHANDRVVTIEELRVPGDARGRLAAKARRLAALLAIAERRVRELHLELISKELGANTHRDFESVAAVQPRRE